MSRTKNDVVFCNISSLKRLISGRRRFVLGPKYPAPPKVRRDHHDYGHHWHSPTSVDGQPQPQRYPTSVDHHHRRIHQPQRSSTSVEGHHQRLLGILTPSSPRRRLILEILRVLIRNRNRRWCGDLSTIRALYGTVLRE